MTQLTHLAFFRAAPGKGPALRTALSALVDPTRAESDCLNYDLHQSLDDPDVWCVYENWTSSLGLEAHMRTPHLQSFLASAPGLLSEAIDLRRYAMISAPAAPAA